MVGCIMSFATNVFKFASNYATAKNFLIGVGSVSAVFGGISGFDYGMRNISELKGLDGQVPDLFKAPIKVGYNIGKVGGCIAVGSSVAAAVAITSPISVPLIYLATQENTTKTRTTENTINVNEN